MDLSGGEFLMFLRTRAKKTQKDVAKALGVTDQTVSNWETGTTVPRLTPWQMRDLCQLLNCSLDELADAFMAKKTA